MAKKGQYIIPLNESEYTSFEVNEFSGGDGFTDEINENISYETAPTPSEALIKVFSFNSDSENKGHSTDTNIESTHSINISKDNSQNKPLNSKNNTNKTMDSTNPSTNRMQKVRGLTPSINGEAFDIKRCYQFRASTIKKLNQLKGESDNINIYLNEIIDSAICYYHNSVFNNK